MKRYLNKSADKYLQNYKTKRKFLKHAVKYISLLANIPVVRARFLNKPKYYRLHLLFCYCSLLTSILKIKLTERSTFKEVRTCDPQPANVPLLLTTSQVSPNNKFNIRMVYIMSGIMVWIKMKETVTYQQSPKQSDTLQSFSKTLRAKERGRLVVQVWISKMQKRENSNCLPLPQSKMFCWMIYTVSGFGGGGCLISVHK